MNKKIVIISSILLLIIIGVGIYYTYDTLAAGTSTSEGEVYNFDITDDSTIVTVPANSSKIVFLKIKNTNNGTVRYGVGYTNFNNIKVLAYEDSFDEMTGLIKKNEYKFIKLRVINNSSSSQSTKISTILGYENGGDLIVPSDCALVTDFYSDNLVKNGNLVYKNNTNFSQFTYGEYSDGRYLSYSGENYVNLYSNEYIEVDPNKKYYISIDAKSSNPNAIYYIGFAEYDIDKRQILAYYYMYVPNSLTYLTKDLNNGDTIVYLNDTSGFGPSRLSGSSSEFEERGFIFWNYKDSTGYMYPPLTYSRNIYYDLFTYDNINYENNTITLTSPWNNGTFKTGTKVSQSMSGAGYNYILLGYKTLSDTYRTYEGEVTGTIDNGKYSPYKFRPGTKYIKPIILFNYNNTPDTTFYMRNFTIKEIK